MFLCIIRCGNISQKLHETPHDTLIPKYRGRNTNNFQNWRVYDVYKVEAMKLPIWRLMNLLIFNKFNQFITVSFN